ncbi:MAG: GNAT family N-acetyltransferase, partial [Bacteroidetes bacterium]|nr:GNAT family N-acetyltransferase [Bacteroidota bacterium]
MKRELSFRQGACPDDIEIVREIVTSSGFFYDREVDVAVELVCERLEKGEASGYYFLFAEYNKKVAGYTCFGSIACTKGCYDLYWIAVHNDFRGQGIGRILLQKTEDII